MNTPKISGTNPDIRPLVQQAIDDGVLPPQAILIIDDPVTNDAPADPERMERWNDWVKSWMADSEGPRPHFHEDDLATRILANDVPPRNLKSTFAEMLDVYMGRSEPPVHDFMRDVIQEAERRVANGDFGLGAPIPRADGGVFRPDLRPNRKQRRAEAAARRGKK